MEKKYQIDQKEYIQLLVHIELFQFRKHFVLVHDLDKDIVRFYHETELESLANKDILDLNKKIQFIKEFNEFRFKKDALNPIELAQKNSLKAHLMLKYDLKSKSHGLDKTKNTTIKDDIDYYHESLIDKLIKYKYFVVLSLLITTIILFYFLSLENIEGHIKIIYDKSFTLKINNKEIGKNVNQIIDLQKGSYQLELVPDSGQSLKRMISIYQNDTIIVDFKETFNEQQLLLTAKRNEPHIKLNVNHRDFDFFINKNKIAKELFPQWIKLEEGDYYFEIVKKGYVSFPSFRTYYLVSGDSLEINFKLEEESKKILVQRASLEVLSNVKEADIYINDKKTSYKTNYIFSDMVSGLYKVSLFKDGFSVKNNHQIVKISNSSNYYDLKFEMFKSSSYLVVNTINARGEILVNGQSKSFGNYAESMPNGNYQLSFGDINGYYTPETRQISINSENNVDIQAIYYPIVDYEGNFTSGYFKSNQFNIKYGYAQFNKFIESSSQKANLVKNDNRYALKMAYPFPYNNPKAGHAIKLEFTLPESFSFRQNLYLDLAIAYTDENYSMLGSLNPEFSIIVNNKTKYRKQKIEHRTSNGNISIQRFKINDMLFNSKNEIIIFLTEDNNVFVDLSAIYLRR